MAQPEWHNGVPSIAKIMNTYHEGGIGNTSFQSRISRHLDYLTRGTEIPTLDLTSNLAAGHAPAESVTTSGSVSVPATATPVSFIFGVQPAAKPASLRMAADGPRMISTLIGAVTRGGFAACGQLRATARITSATVKATARHPVI